MKKLLGLFVGISTIGSSISSVIACGLGYAITPVPFKEQPVTADFSSNKVALSKNLTKTNIDLTLSKVVDDVEEVSVTNNIEKYIVATATKVNALTKKSTISLEIISEPSEDIVDTISVVYNNNIVGSFAISVQSFNTDIPVSVSILKPVIDLSYESKVDTVDLLWSTVVDTSELKINSNKSNSLIDITTENINTTDLKSKINLSIVDLPIEDVIETLTLSLHDKILGSFDVNIKGYTPPTEEIIDQTITSEFEKNIFNFSKNVNTNSSTVKLSNLITGNGTLDYIVPSILNDYLDVTTTQINTSTKASIVSATIKKLPTENVAGSIKIAYGGKTLGEIGVNILTDDTELKATFSKNQIRVAQNNWDDSISVNFSKLIGENRNLTITSNLGSKGYVSFKAEQINSQAMSTTISLSVDILPENISNEILSVEYAGVIIGKITIDLFESQSTDKLVLSSTRVNFTDLTPIKIEIVNFKYLTGEVNAEYKVWSEYFTIDVNQLITQGFFMAKMIKVPEQKIEAIINVQIYSNSNIEPAYVYLTYNPENK